MRDTEANEWDGVHITGYDTMLPLRNSISPPRETSIPSIKSTLMPPNHSKLTSVMIAQEYDDHRIFGYLGSTVHDANLSHWMGDIARKRDTGAREYVRVSPYCSCDSQIQAAKSPLTAIPSTIDYRTSEARRSRSNYKHKRDHDILSSVSVSADDSCCCRNE